MIRIACLITILLCLTSQTKKTTTASAKEPATSVAIIATSLKTSTESTKTKPTQKSQAQKAQAQKSQVQNAKGRKRPVLKAITRLAVAKAWPKKRRPLRRIAKGIGRILQRRK